MSTKYCLDCIRENVLVPRVRARSTVYCTHHVYIRTKISRIRKVIKEAVDTEQYDILQAKGRDGKFQIDLPTIGKFAEDYRAEARRTLEFMNDLYDKDPSVERNPYLEEASRLLIIAESLIRRRQLSATEKTSVMQNIKPDDLEKEQSSSEWSSRTVPQLTDVVPAAWQPRPDVDPIGRDVGKPWGPA